VRGRSRSSGPTTSPVASFASRRVASESAGTRHRPLVDAKVSSSTNIDFHHDPAIRAKTAWVVFGPPRKLFPIDRPVGQCKSRIASSAPSVSRIFPSRLNAISVTPPEREFRPGPGVADHVHPFTRRRVRMQQLPSRQARRQDGSARARSWRGQSHSRWRVPPHEPTSWRHRTCSSWPLQSLAGSVRTKCLWTSLSRSQIERVAQH